jgi:predicted esterase
MEFRLQEDGLLVGAYFGDSDTNVIFCSGVPQYASNYHPFMQDLFSSGCNVFVPRYAGTWESGGDFTPQSSAESIAKTVELAKRGSAFETFSQSQKTWMPNMRTVLVGFSYGAMPALANAHFADKTVLLMPFVTAPEGDSSTVDMKQTLEFLGRGYKNVYRSSLSTDDFLAQYKGVYNELKNQPVTVLRGANDKAISEAQFEWLQQNCLASITEIEAKHTANVGHQVYEGIVS